jgi:universal stress protein A
MIPFKKIICPTDFSEPSYEGVKAAHEMALHFSAELVLVHVVPPMTHIPIPVMSISEGFDVNRYQKEMILHAKKSLNNVVKDMISEKVSSREEVIEGNAADKIVELAESENADAIITATHGLTGWRHLIFGSVAEKVVRLSSCPVLTIPVPPEEK